MFMLTESQRQSVLSRLWGASHRAGRLSAARVPAGAGRPVAGYAVSGHARIHRLGAIRRWLPETVLGLWREQHPGVPFQLQLAIERPATQSREAAAA